MRRKSKLVKHEHHRDGHGKRRTGKNCCTAQPRSQSQPLLQLRNVRIELAVIAHTSSRGVPIWPLPKTVSTKPISNASSIKYHQRLTHRYVDSFGATAAVFVAPLSH